MLLVNPHRPGETSTLGKVAAGLMALATSACSHDSPPAAPSLPKPTASAPELPPAPAPVPEAARVPADPLAVQKEAIRQLIAHLRAGVEAPAAPALDRLFENPPPAQNFSARSIELLAAIPHDGLPLLLKVLKRENQAVQAALFNECAERAARYPLSCRVLILLSNDGELRPLFRGAALHDFLDITQSVPMLKSLAEEDPQEMGAACIAAICSVCKAGKEAGRAVPLLFELNRSFQERCPKDLSRKLQTPIATAFWDMGEDSRPALLNALRLNQGADYELARAYVRASRQTLTAGIAIDEPLFGGVSLASFAYEQGDHDLYRRLLKELPDGKVNQGQVNMLIVVLQKSHKARQQEICSLTVEKLCMVTPPPYMFPDLLVRCSSGYQAETRKAVVDYLQRHKFREHYIREVENAGKPQVEPK